MSVAMLTLDIGIFFFNPLLALPGRLRANFRWINLVLASDGVNSAASIASRNVSVGARIRSFTAFVTFSLLTKLCRGMVGEQCNMSSNKIHEVNRGDNDEGQWRAGGIGWPCHPPRRVLGTVWPE